MSKEEKEQRLKQPKVFKLSSLTAMCERFGFYILSYLIVLYAKSAFGFSDVAAFALFAIFNSLVYITPAIGGYLADNWLGIRRGMILGLFLEGLGLLVLSIPQNSRVILAIAMAMIIIGVGFFKTGPTNLLARAYDDKDSRIDSGFTLFYMAMNVGSFLASFVTGALMKYSGFHLSFLAGGIALLVGLSFYFIWRKAASHGDSKPGQKKFPAKQWLYAIVGITTTCVAISFLINFNNIANLAIFIVAILIFTYFGYEILRSNKKDKLRIIACLFLIITGMVFFILYFQYYESMVLFIKRSLIHHIDIHLHLLSFAFYKSYRVPTTVFLSFNALWILLLSPVVAMIYNYLGKHGKDLAVTTKFPLGLLITSLCFFILVLGCHLANTEYKVCSGWFFLAIALYSLGELLISALGVAMVTRIAPKRMYGVMMGSWFLIAAALASSLSGKMANWAQVPASINNNKVILHIYSHAFMKMGLFGLGAAIIVFLISPFIKKIAQLED